MGIMTRNLVYPSNAQACKVKDIRGFKGYDRPGYTGYYLLVDIFDTMIS